MQIIAKVITEISGDTYLTCSIIIPIVACMKNTIRQRVPTTSIGAEFKEAIIYQIEKRFNDIESFEILCISTILDPRFKKIHFQKAMSASHAIDTINRKMKSAVSPDPIQLQLQLRTENNNLKNDIWNYHDDLVKKTGAAKNSTDGLTFELKQYLSQPVISRTEDPLKHWNLLQPSYPNLYNVAIEYLCVVGTSVPSERLLSFFDDWKY
ncbi:GSCOCG00010249001-RA-CDS [Cotesia congregata]|nr:GSCOCG00010249001-RA-CDS [Cotesia congregata]